MDCIKDMEQLDLILGCVENLLELVSLVFDYFDTFCEIYSNEENKKKTMKIEKLVAPSENDNFKEISEKYIELVKKQKEANINLFFLLDTSLLKKYVNFYEGKNYEFNFSKFWTFTRTKFNCKETEDEIIWHVEQKTLTAKMVTDIKCKKKDMLLINYEAPNGLKKHNRLWNGGNGRGIIKLYARGKLVDKVICENVGCEFGEYDC